jgi:signal transduction histidine kinase
VLGWFGLAVIAFCMVRVVSYYRRTGFQDPFEASAFIFVLIAAVADIIMVRFFFIYGVSLGAAVMFFPLALLLSLAARARGVFEAATATAEKLNVLVAERERVIVANMDEIRRNERAAMLLEERSRIMRDMHDGIGGQLLGLILQARSHKLSDETLVSGLEQSLDDLRLVVDSLEQGEGSLTGALGAFRARIEPRCEAAGVELGWEIEDVGATPNIGPDKTLQIYRILLEACTNALKHGAPKRIGVLLKRNGEFIEIGLTDDGPGFAVHTAPTGRGLANMRTRAEQIGAALELDSNVHGTRVTLALAA